MTFMIYYASTTSYRVVIGVERHPVLLPFVFLNTFLKMEVPWEKLENWPLNTEGRKKPKKEADHS